MYVVCHVYAFLWGRSWPDYRRIALYRLKKITWSKPSNIDERDLNSEDYRLYYSVSLEFERGIYSTQCVISVIFSGAAKLSKNITKLSRRRRNMQKHKIVWRKDGVCANTVESGRSSIQECRLPYSSNDTWRCCRYLGKIGHKIFCKYSLKTSFYIFLQSVSIRFIIEQCFGEAEGIGCCISYHRVVDGQLWAFGHLHRHSRVMCTYT